MLKMVTRTQKPNQTENCRLTYPSGSDITTKITNRDISKIQSPLDALMDEMGKNGKEENGDTENADGGVLIKKGFSIARLIHENGWIIPRHLREAEKRVKN